MKTLKELRARLDAILAEYRTLNETAGDTPLDAEQQTRWDALDTEEAEIRARITELEEAEARAERVAASRAKWQSLQVGGKVDPAGIDIRSSSPRELRDGALKRMEEASDEIELNDAQLTHLGGLLRKRNRNFDGARLAARLLITESPEYRSAFAKAIASQAPAWTPEEARAMQEFRAYAEGTNSTGGFGVPVLIDPTIMLTSQAAFNPFRRIARVETITTSSWKGVSSDAVSWSFDAEAGEVSDDSTTLAGPEVPVHMARGFVAASIEVGEDYPNLANELGVLLSEGYDLLEDEKFAVGSGVGEPTGIVTALDANTNVEVAVTTDGALGIADIDKVWRALPNRAKSNATWVMGSGTAATIAALGDAYGTRTVDLAGNLERLRLRPVEPSDYIPDFAGLLTAANLLVVGDFRKFLIAQRAGMSIEYVPHLFGTTNNRPTGQRGWFAWARVGSDSIDDLAFRLLQNV